MKRFAIPLAILTALLVSVAIGLRAKPQESATPSADKLAPSFTLNRLEQEQASFSTQDMRGKVWLLNVWASWCTSCRAEHPVLLDFARQGIAPVVGLDYMDACEDGRKWLDRHGNPYQLAVLDADGKVGTSYGVVGVPETFVIDKRGVVRLKLAGGLTPEIVRDKLIPLIRELNRA